MATDPRPLLEDERARQGKKQASRLLWIILLTLCLCIVGTVTNVLSKSVADVYSQRYAFFVDQASNVVYLMLTSVPVIFQWVRGKIPESTRKFPQRKYALLGLLSALSTYLSAVGAVQTPGQLQTVLNQLIIPTSMVASFIVLRTRFSCQEGASVMVILLGAIMTCGTAAAPGWPPALVVFTLANVPSALSGVYTELALGSEDIDIWYMNFVTTFYQTMISFALIPLQTIPYLSGSVEGTGFSFAWEGLVGGCSCFVGISPGDNSTDCSQAGLLLTTSNAVSMVSGILGLLLMKTGSELGIGQLLCSLVTALKLPFSVLIFSSPFIMGRRAEPTGILTWVSVTVVAMGFLWHIRARPEVASEEDEGDEHICPKHTVSRRFALLATIDHSCTFVACSNAGITRGQSIHWADLEAGAIQGCSVKNSMRASSCEF